MRPGLVVIAVVVLAGCGGEDKPSKEEFARSADAICADLERQSERLSETKATNTQDIVEYAESVQSTAQQAIDRVGDLDVPDGADGEVAQAWKDAVTSQAEDELIPALDRLEKAARDKNEQGMLAAAQELQALESSRAERLATDLGARRCAD